MGDSPSKTVHTVGRNKIVSSAGLNLLIYMDDMVFFCSGSGLEQEQAMGQKTHLFCILCRKCVWLDVKLIDSGGV